MKNLLLLAITAVFLIGGCSSKPKEEVILLQPYTDAIAALNDINMAVVQKFKEYDAEMAYASLRLDRLGMTAARSEVIVASLQRIDGYVRLSGTLNTSGKRLYTTPMKYFQASGGGETISNAPAIMEQVRRGRKVLSDAYQNKCNELVVDYICPVKGDDEIVHGAIYMQIAITELLRHYVTERITAMPVNVWVMQTDGLLVYDTSPEEINQNILTGDYFKDYPSLIQLAQKIANFETGTGSYRYLTKGNKVEMVKNAQWNSVTLGGRQLRLVLNVEDRSYAK